MQPETMTPEEADEAVRSLRQMEMDVRDAAARGEPVPAWVNERPPHERTLLKLWHHHEAAYCAPRMRGEAPF